MKRFTLVLSLIILCVIPTTSHAMTQTQMACGIVNRWPSDYAQGWPVAVQKHNASPNTVTAAGYMNNLMEIYKQTFKINQTNALNIIDNYEAYWRALEQDYIRNNGKLPAAGLQTNRKILVPLLQYCAKNK